jgi:hypothetical protein
MERFYELSDDTVNDFNEVFMKKSFPISIKLQFIGDSKQKGLIKITKMPDDMAFILGKEVKIIINEELLTAFDEESIQILFEQEIDKININLETGKIKIRKTDLNTFSSIVNKWGVDAVARANKVEELYQEQQKDANNEEFIV